VLASSPDDPAYGRIILGEGDRIAKMVEYKDATEEERAVRLCNSGMMAVRAPTCSAGSARSATTMRRANIICPTSSTSPRRGPRGGGDRGRPYETAGVNSRAELAHLELEWQRRRREQALSTKARP
jgi:bifunctional UDP-N-acetylglucosamine pyrophosphorylase/glucosamine-1-phosphate N-acetyltransferase